MTEILRDVAAFASMAVFVSSMALLMMALWHSRAAKLVTKLLPPDFLLDFTAAKTENPDRFR